MAPKDINRDYESTKGYLKFEDLPSEIDWTSQESIQKLFPDYYRALLAQRATGKKADMTVQIDGFSLRTPYNDADLFLNTKLQIEPNKRCALFGNNGSGKTSLFNAISSKRVQGFPSYMNVHHMKELEHDEAADAISVFDTIVLSHKMLRIMLVIESHLTSLVADNEGSDELESYKENLVWAKRVMTSIEGYTYEKRIKEMLRVLGFDEIGEAAPLSSLSGGLRMRVALASAFFVGADLLLLDEPTNHLDMPSVLWLENKLRGYKGSFLLVTHDRTLLENVVTSVVLIYDYKLCYYDTGFAEFEKQKEVDDKEREKKIERFLERNKNIDQSTPLYKTKVKYQKWMQKRNDRLIMIAGKFTFKAPKPLPCPEETAQKDISLIKIDNVRFSYDVEKGLPFIFDNPISYNVKVGTRVGVMGPNGAGKSTFLKLITGKLTPTDGTITTNPNYTLAYFGQHSTKELSLELTPIEFMQKSFPKEKAGILKAHLEKTSISYGPQNTRMKSLSFSQRSCVIFAKLTFVPPHLLIMDEPTNFLDLDSVDALIGAVKKFKGGLITVTHNRDFLKRCSKHFLSIVPGAFLEYKTFKQAERATYSFITALEEGKAIDVKNAIVNNRGGGAIHTEEYLAKNAARIAFQDAETQRKVDEETAIREAAEKVAADKEAARQKKLALMKTDWAAGETCWAPVKGKYVQGTVLRAVKSMGVTVTLASGKNVMVEAKKLRVENPDAGSESAPAEKKGGSRGAKSGSRGGRGRGGSRGGRGRGGSRGGRGRGGSRGGRGRGGRGRGRGRGAARK